MEGNIQEETKNKIEMKLLLRNIMLGCLGFLMGRAGFGGLYPLSLVYWSVLSESNRNIMVMVTLTTAIGLCWQGNILNLHYLLAGFIGYAIFRLVKRSPLNSLPGWISLVFLGSGLLLNYYRQTQVYQYLMTGGEAILIYILINLERGGMKELLNRKKQLTGQAVITIFILSSGAVVGLANLQLIPRIWLIVPLYLIVIGVARHLGLIYSVTGAVFFGMILVVAGIINLIIMAKFIVLAVSCGLFQKRQKYWMIPGILLAFFIYSGFAPTIKDLQETIIELTSAGIIFLILPDSFWHYLFAGLIKDTELDKLSLSPEVAGSLSGYLQELAGVFQELSATFREVIPEDQEDKFADFRYLFRGRLCRHCPRVRICWQQEREKTHRLLKLMLSTGEERNVLSREVIEKYLGKHCIYYDKISDPLKAIFELYQVNSFWRDRLSDKQQIVSEQLAGVGEMLKQFSDSSRLTLRSSAPLERIRARALEREIDLHNIEINTEINSDKINLEIEMEPCTGNRPCEEQLLNLFNQEYEWNYRILERKCGDKLKDHPCQLLYGPRGNYYLDLAVIQEAVDGGVSGDSYLHHPLRNGEDLIVLSDGMGTGRKAARESKAAINLLTSILDAGFDQQLAIKTINSALYLRNQDENFTTLDLALFDTFTGQIIFSKIGAVTSYIKRNWELMEIESSSLPVGILSKVDTSTTAFQLKDGDFVVMLTDGVLDAGRLNPGQNGEEILKQLIRNSSFGQARDLAEYIREVMVVDQEKIRDDFTILVFLVEEFLPKRRKFKV